MRGGITVPILLAVPLKSFSNVVRCNLLGDSGLLKLCLSNAGQGEDEDEGSGKI